MFLLESGKHHLCSRDVLLRSLEVYPECVWSPCDAFVLVGISVLESRGLTSLAANQTVKVGPGLMLTALYETNSSMYILVHTKEVSNLLWYHPLDHLRYHS